MSAREVTLYGGSPWGFRMHGGCDTHQPLRISRAQGRDRRKSLKILFRESAIFISFSVFLRPSSLVRRFLQRRVTGFRTEIALARNPFPLTCRLSQYYGPEGPICLRRVEATKRTCFFGPRNRRIRGLRRVAGLDIGGEMRSLGESGERGMDQDQDERCEKETDEVQFGESATQRTHRTASRDPDSNIVLGIGRPASLSEPTGFGAISHEIHATKSDLIPFFDNLLLSSAKNGSAIDRKPSAGHYCAGLLSGDNSRGRRRSSSSPSSLSRKHRGWREQVHQVIVFSQRDRKWRVWGGMLRIVKRTSERQSNNDTDIYIAICFSCPWVQRRKIDFELGQSLERQLLEEVIPSFLEVAIYLIVTATSFIPSLLPKSKQHHGKGQPENFPCCSAVAEKSGAGMTAVQQCILFRGRAPEQDQNETFYLAIFTCRGSVLSTTRVSNEGVLRDVEVPSRIRPTEMRQHGENLKRLELKSQLDMRRDVAGRKLIFLDVNPGSKAAQQGVREGDLISNINERSTRDLTNSEAHALLRNSGEQLKLGLNQENIGSPKRRIYRSSLQENTTTEIQNSRDHHKDHNDNAHTDGVGEERCQTYDSDRSSSCIALRRRTQKLPTHDRRCLIEHNNPAS
ncbi:hypothetical protein ALC56_07936 [Trachymyrmex septentrionalis]|uniref:PDZ domain-containing protein n=1 Tax=Trachymyrmex septentrionalis TaxID=34720 RepID=A0A195FC07_9HYME|nr:hypothetical protein ALC56_07936 [Trachymyrmex septentrionalis]